MTRLVMVDSVAYWALKPIEARILAVIEIEHMRHGGVENGRLIVTRRQFEKRGIHKDAIAPGLRALEALGFIEIMERGVAGVGDHVQAHRFRLTYVQPNPTDEWRKFYDANMARAAAETARQSTNIRARRLGLRGAQKQIAGPENGTGKVPKTGPATQTVEPKTLSIGPENGTTIYISGDRGASHRTGHDAAAGGCPLPSNARHADSAQQTVVVLPPRAPELRPLTRNLSP
jgi:hypothetical protein